MSVDVPSSPANWPNLYMIGFMGTGKSSICRRVAHRLGMQHIDVDDEIVRESGMSITEIFDTHGETHFRQLESTFIKTGHPDVGCIVSCGGGLVTQEGMATLLKSKGILFCLHASVETILKRTSGNTKRPLLQVEDPQARIREMLEERQPYYSQAQASVLTDHRGIPEIVEHVIRGYRELVRLRSD